MTGPPASDLAHCSCDPSSNGFQFTENYVLGTGGEQLTMLDGNNNWERTNLYAGGKLIGTYDMVTSNGTQAPALHLHLEDGLGTRRMQISGMLSNLGQPETDFQSLPFGDQLATYPDPYADQTADDATPLHFTGKERDSESGNDYFGARYYASTMGRWLSPDPLPWPHWQNGSDEDRKRFAAYILNPQNFNEYNYVLNNPLTGIDPDGMTVYVIAYTTGNHEGGDDELKRAAQTKKDEITSSKGFDPKKDTVIIGGVHTKQDFQNLLNAAASVSDQFGKVGNLTLFSHSGDLNGPVFHTASGKPDQYMSVAEMKSIAVNWAQDATATFYGCRSANNFAQDFANAQRVKSFGFTDAVDFSGSPNSKSKWYVLNGQFQRYMIDQGEQGLKERDPQ